MRRNTSRLTALAASVSAAALVLAGLGAASAEPTSPSVRAGARLTNLDHLDWLRDTVEPPAQAGHTTFNLGEEPGVDQVWTYADRNNDGTYRRVGGGAYDASTDTYGQGAFNADDTSRAAVVYLRDWRQTGSRTSRDAAFELLRGLTYLQTATGPNAGNVVLWMQPDGTLNPSAEPVEQPDPSDSGPSYWLARTIWALGEGYRGFETADPAFARFLKARLDLAIDALDRQVLSKYGTYLRVDGVRVPAWLVVDGADASAEAVLGLASYVGSGDADPQARRVLRQLTEGIAMMSAGDARHWPFDGVQPWALSRGNWHAWASQMPAGLARASRVLDGDVSRTAAAAARRDSFTFDPWLLTSGGPDNGRLPTRTDTTQIAYGVDSRVQSLLATGGPAAQQLAGLTASWYFGANASGGPTYDPATGITFDGVAGDGTVNHNSGAESTIHGLLSMLALDANPEAKRIARTATITRRVAPTTLQAEDGELTGDATVQTPGSLWTGESLLGGTGYVAMGDGGSVRLRAGAQPASLAMPVTWFQHGSSAVTSYSSRRAGVDGTTVQLGEVAAGAVGRSGDSAGPGALLPSTLAARGNNARLVVDATTRASDGDVARLDAVVLQPLVTMLVQGGPGHGTALVRSAGERQLSRRVSVPGDGALDVWVYDGQGQLAAHRTVDDSGARVTLPAGGFAFLRR